MTLEALQMLPRGATGWGTEPLKFGRGTTLLLGPNGAGKTPLLKALAYCLGHPVELPPLVLQKCRGVKVWMSVDGAGFEIERQFEIGVVATVTEPSGATRSLRDERSLSEWVLPKLGISLRVLSGKNGEKVSPYMSVVGPMFFVDQDAGWQTSYVPFETHQFVKDQREEVFRWMLDVPARNRPTDKSEFEAAKTALASIREQIAFKRHALEALQRELGEDRAVGTAARLEERKVSLESDLKRAYANLESVSQIVSGLDVRVNDSTQRRDQVAYRLANANRRKGQLVEVQAEINAELSALEENEIAAEVFRNLCGNEACQFFRNPEESYGRRVLYLKDQLKDFESTAGETERELGILRQQLAAAEEGVRQAVDEKRRSLQSTAAGAAATAVEAISRELADVRVRLDRLERIGNARKQLDALIDRELRASETVDELRPTAGPRKDNSRLLDARQHLAATFKEWLVTLHTPNVAADVMFDEELKLTVSGELFSAKSSHSGSTRTRIVLAYHAAMLQTSLLMNGSHPRLLVLDAPRQHELNAADLRSYIVRFHALSKKETPPVQLVFSATDVEVVPKGRVDSLWEPPFLFNGEPRFLG